MRNALTLNDPIGAKTRERDRFPDAFDLTSPLDAARYLLENDLQWTTLTLAPLGASLRVGGDGNRPVKISGGLPSAPTGRPGGGKTSFGDHLNTAAILAADLYSGGQIRRQAKKAGRNLFEPLVDFKATQDALDTWHSDDYKKQQTAL